MSEWKLETLAEILTMVSHSEKMPEICEVLDKNVRDDLILCLSDIETGKKLSTRLSEYVDGLVRYGFDADDVETLSEACNETLARLKDLTD